MLLTPSQVISALREKSSCFGKIDPSVYHSLKITLEEEFGMPVVSKSSLADFAKNPYKFNWERANDIRQSSDALALGSLVDCLSLTPELFSSLYSVQPVRVALKKDGSPYADGRQCPLQKQEWANLAQNGFTVISPERLAHAQSIADRASAHLQELSLSSFAFDSQIGLWLILTNDNCPGISTPIILTGLVDIAPISTLKPLIDLKTTSEDISSPARLFRTMETYSYPLQAGTYSFLWHACTGEDSPRNFAFLFVSTSDPVMSRLVSMESAACSLYKDEALRLCRLYADAHKLQDWGSPSLDPINFFPQKKH